MERRSWAAIANLVAGIIVGIIQVFVITDGSWTSGVLPVGLMIVSLLFYLDWRSRRGKDVG